MTHSITAVPGTDDWLCFSACRVLLCYAPVVNRTEENKTKVSHVQENLVEVLGLLKWWWSPFGGCSTLSTLGYRVWNAALCRHQLEKEQNLLEIQDTAWVESCLTHDITLPLKHGRWASSSTISSLTTLSINKSDVTNAHLNHHQPDMAQCFHYHGSWSGINNVPR